MENSRRFRTMRQRGQTLVLFLGFAAAMVGMLLVAFNSGQVSNAKMRAMNAADAAAYSGAVWEARSLNYQAYINRAMVVNEVTIAQSVSLRSWISYLSRFVTNINYITQFIPGAGAATRAIERALAATNNAVQRGMPAAEIFLRGVSQAEHGSQVLMHNTTVLAAQDLARAVAARNGASLTPANVGLWGANEKKWRELTDTYNGRGGNIKDGDRRRRLKEVTLASRDGFTQERDWKLGSKWIQTEVRKQGGTDLIDYDAWKGLDSAEWRNIYIKDWVTRIPLGWGGAQSYNPNVVSRVGQHGNINEWNNTDGRWANADSRRRPNASRNVGGGFPGYRDIVDPRRQNETLNVPFAVEVVINGRDIPSANSINGAKALLSNGTMIEHDPHYVSPNAGVYALGEACVTFERPYRADRADGRKEFPSLFNPYWRASLATESAISRTIVDGAKGLIPVAALTGESTCRTIASK